MARYVLSMIMQFAGSTNILRKLSFMFICAAVLYFIPLFILDNIMIGFHDKTAHTFGFVTVYIFILFPLALILLCILTIFMALSLAYTITPVLGLGEFIVRRIAEYPKGPIIGLSAAFGSIVVIIKTFT
jgi:hypothetical protein